MIIITMEINTVTCKSGSSGKAVKLMQGMLNIAGGYGLALDGSFGPKTLAAVKAYQQSAGLSVDGSCGPLTWAALAKTVSA